SLKPWPGLLNEIKESPCATTNIKKLQFALIASSKSFIKLRQCLASNGVGRSVQKHLDLGIVSFSGIVRHPAIGLEVEILQIIARSLPTRSLAEHFVVRVAFAASMDFGKIFKEEHRATNQGQKRSIVIGRNGINSGLYIGDVLHKKPNHIRI